MEPQPYAPPVVAVVVADEPGPWFEEALVSLGAQDYPNQSVLVMDSGRSAGADVSRRVAAVLPDAYLRRMSSDSGFAAVANDVLETVKGASFLVFCRDHVALEPDAVRLMVEEALRSNAGVVGPKVVEWDRPDRLLDVGLAVDKTGACTQVVEPGELDQEQHDGVRDVFAVSATCMLVRADLFGELGGFDPTMGDHGADVDFCWRAQLVGARVVVAPDARARHHLGGTEPVDAGIDRLITRNHLRSMLKNYSLLHLARVLPQAAVVTVFEAVIAVLARRWGEARELVSAWWWNLRHLRDLRAMRRAVKRARAVPDSEVRRLQVRGSVRLTFYLQRRFHAEERAQALVAAGQELVGTVAGRGPVRAAMLLLGVVLLAIVVGSRDLISERLPAVGELAPLPRPSALLTEYLSGWRTSGLGSEWAPPPLFALLGAAGALLLGNVDLLQKVLVLGAWPVAAVGVWRLVRPFGSTLARVVGLVAYLVVPLPYNALAVGAWGALVAYALGPWLLYSLLRMTNLEPFVDGGSEAARWPRLLGFGVLLAAAAVLVPSVAIAMVLAGIGLVIGSLVVGGRLAAAGAAVAAAVAAGIAFVLLLPWSVQLLLPEGWSTLTGVPRTTAAGHGLGALLRFHVGPMGAGPLGWGFLCAAALPLVLGKGWRLAWAVRLWMAALTCVGVAWASGRGWVPVRFEAPHVLLALAAVALAAAVALGAVAFEVDLRGYRFGWRQGVSVAAGALLGIATLPLLGAVPDGRWGLPGNEVARSVAWMEAEAADGAFRVLWIGDPAVLPVDGWRLADGVAYATSRDGPPQANELLPGPPTEATETLAGALRVAADGGTVRLGRLLAPMAVRYVVVPRQLAAGEADDDGSDVPAGFSQALSSQLDLRILPSDASVAVYENTSWGPGRASVGAPIATGAFSEGLGAGADLSANRPVLPGSGPVRFSGPLPDGSQVFVSESPSSRWDLRVGGDQADRSDAFGVANVFAPDRAGPATLRFRTPVPRYALIVAQLALWALALRLLWWDRARRPVDPAHRPAVTPSPAPPQPAPSASLPTA
ncbi:MAG: glycosyltransferase [Actinomycetota bacterium]|nr:glycosyltransferase [Actinomycetota bacterium]